MGGRIFADFPLLASTMDVITALAPFLLMLSTLCCCRLGSVELSPDEKSKVLELLPKVSAHHHFDFCCIGGYNL